MKPVIDTDSRVLRGGAFLNQLGNVRSADRSLYLPANRFSDIGFRPARTYP